MNKVRLLFCSALMLVCASPSAIEKSGILECELIDGNLKNRASQTIDFLAPMRLYYNSSDQNAYFTARVVNERGDEDFQALSIVLKEAKITIKEDSSMQLLGAKRIQKDGGVQNNGEDIYIIHHFSYRESTGEALLKRISINVNLRKEILLYSLKLNCHSKMDPVYRLP